MDRPIPTTSAVKPTLETLEALLRGPTAPIRPIPLSVDFTQRPPILPMMSPPRQHISAIGVPPTFAGLPPISVPVSVQASNANKPNEAEILSNNTHLSALLKQFNEFVERMKLNPIPLNAVEQPKPPPPPPKQNIIKPTPVKGTMGMDRSLMQPMFPMSSQTVSGRSHNAQAPILPPGFSGYGWPMTPFGNPYMPYFPNPLQLAMLQNQFISQQSSSSSSQPTDTNNKKRKAPTEATKPQIKRAREIERDLHELNQQMPKLQPMLPFP